MAGEITNVHRWASACVSLPTCPLALTESERALPDFLKELDGEVARLVAVEVSFVSGRSFGMIPEDPA